ncbi:MAG: outer membrane lipoprotein-sorting protein [Verrucomicrobiota bacterium JB022]|nr:outer membrane lipoprotein-sorting protein [Verrucomicrobiota bacterium JB022]
MHQFRIPALLLALSALTAAAPLHAQPRNRPSPVIQGPEQLNEAEGHRVLQQFRQIGWPGDFAFRFRLLHYPRGGKTEVYYGTLYGAWNAQHPETRVDFDPLDGERQAYLWEGNRESWHYAGAGEPTPLDGETLHQPLLPGLVYTPFDFQIPFLEWQDYVYEGTHRVAGRPAHYYLMYPPSDDPRYAEIGAVRIMIDADFYAILRAEVLSPEEKIIRTLRVGSFKKVDDQWVVTRFDLSDERTRTRTRLEFDAAALGRDLPDTLFTPESLEAPYEALPRQAFRSL